MDFTNLARLTGQKASGMLLSPPTHLWNCRNVSSFLLFYMDAKHPDSGPYVFAGSVSPTDPWHILPLQEAGNQNMFAMGPRAASV